MLSGNRVQERHRAGKLAHLEVAVGLQQRGVVEPGIRVQHGGKLGQRLGTSPGLVVGQRQVHPNRRAQVRNLQRFPVGRDRVVEPPQRGVDDAEIDERFEAFRLALQERAIARFGGRQISGLLRAGSGFEQLRVLRRHLLGAGA